MTAKIVDAFGGVKSKTIVVLGLTFNPNMVNVELLRCTYDADGTFAQHTRRSGISSVA